MNDTLTKWNWASKNMYEYRRFSWKLKSVNRMTSKTHTHTNKARTSKCHQRRTDHFYGFKSTNNAHKKRCKSNYKIIIESWIHLLLKRAAPVNSKTQVEGNGVREPIPLTDLSYMCAACYCIAEPCFVLCAVWHVHHRRGLLGIAIYNYAIHGFELLKENKRGYS